MAATDRSDASPSSTYRPRVTFLRRRPRPGALVRGPDDLPLPHERDQQQGMTDGRVTPEGRQGHEDLARGMRDTSKSEEMDRTYRKIK